mmetsp:Transcript_115913/g.247703  ORF Transcript_115913/g.247703 Transcript_115913/m.247703 type:complete len:211 (+) Transcript_115913:1435-2067(+)
MASTTAAAASAPCRFHLGTLPRGSRDRTRMAATSAGCIGGQTLAASRRRLTAPCSRLRGFRQHQGPAPRTFLTGALRLGPTTRRSSTLGGRSLACSGRDGASRWRTLGEDHLVAVAEAINSRGGSGVQDPVANRRHAEPRLRLGVHLPEGGVGVREAPQWLVPTHAKDLWLVTAPCRAREEMQKAIGLRNHGAASDEAVPPESRIAKRIT